MREATAEFVQSLPSPIPVLACHAHFLSDIGEDLLEKGHDQLRDLFRKVGLLPQLRAFSRQQGRNRRQTAWWQAFEKSLDHGEVPHGTQHR